MVVEYPKRVYKGDESIVVNTKEEESEYLGFIPIELISKLPSCEDLQISAGMTTDEIMIANKIAENDRKILKRKPGRPHSKI